MQAKGNILKSIKSVYVKAENSELSAKFFKDIRHELRFLSKQLKISQKQALFYSIIFCRNISHGSVNLSDLIQYLNCDSLDFLQYQSDITKLFDKGYINKEANRHRYRKGILHEDFEVNKTIQEAILLKKEIRSVGDVKLSKAVDLVDFLYALMRQVASNELTFFDALISVNTAIKKNKQIPLLLALLNDKLSIEDICILIYYIGSYRMGDRVECVKSLSMAMYGENGTSANLIQNMAAGSHTLVKSDFIKNSGITARSEFQFELTGKSKGLMRTHQIIPEFETKICADTFEFLYTIDTLFERRNNEIISASELLNMITQLIYSNEDLKIVVELKKLGIRATQHEAIYLQALYDGAISSDTSIDHVSDAVFENKRDAVFFQNDIMQETNELVQADFLEVTGGSFFSRSKLQITELSQNLLMDCGLKLPEKQKNNYSIQPENIKIKPLFYNDENDSQMNMLREILDDKNFSSIQKRMAEKALPTGIIALLYGLPGTGKTESVYQFAKRTGREVIQVDISQSKSMWFGESEKQIKKIFTKYEQYSKHCKIKPILLFNEADAIISKRKDAASSNVAQTENAIQNIILEEFEKFTGICIATTNLVANLDSAFERRFLYKIELTKPTVTTLSKIWNSKLSNATGYDTYTLASQFPFSGGQIDNIVKKIEMHEILHGSLPTQSKVEAWCDEEGFQNNDRKNIGYLK